jgi:hypothetical protein
MTLQELLPRAEWLLDYLQQHPIEAELYNFVYGRGDVELMQEIAATRRLNVQELDGLLSRFEKRLPLVNSARWN